MNTIKKHTEQHFEQEKELVIQHERSLAQEENINHENKAFFLFRLFTKDYSGFIKYLPFVIYLFALGIIYVWNGDYANKILRDTSELIRNNKKLGYKNKMLQSEWYNQTQSSIILERLKPFGFKELDAPPYSIKIVNTITEIK